MSRELDEFLMRSQQGCTLTELAAWFSCSPVIDTAFMLGHWVGGVFNTGHVGEGMLERLRWIGKDFISLEDVAPIVCQDEQGKRVANPVLGSARLRMVVPPGESAPSVAMVYDVQPIIDYFKRIDSETVLGVMDRKGDTIPLYFYLRRCS